MNNYKKDLAKIYTILLGKIKSENVVIKNLADKLIKVIDNEFNEDSKSVFMLVLNNREELKELTNNNDSLIKVGKNEIRVRYLTDNLNHFQGFHINDFYLSKPNENNRTDESLEHRKKILHELIMRTILSD